MGSVEEPVKGVEQDDLVMPIIDFSTFLNGTPDQKLITARQILHAFKTSGFLYLSNHSISPTTVSEAFRISAQFFTRPQAQKDALAWSTPAANRGYVASGREKVTNLTDAAEVAKLRASNPDLKESFEIGRENEPGHPNEWPDRFHDESSSSSPDPAALEFTTFMKSFHTQLADLHTEVMRAIGIGLMGTTAGAHFFDTFTDAHDNTLRLLHYPTVNKAVFADNPEQVRAGAHSDYGSVTLLFQDDVGGLEVMSPRGTWVRATPIPDTIVVNAGDLLSRWSNDLVVSTKHRVIQPPPKEQQQQQQGSGEEGEGGSDMYPARYSIAYFCNPNFDRYIEALPGTYQDVKDIKYQGINSGEYLVQRLAATY